RVRGGPASGRPPRLPARADRPRDAGAAGASARRPLAVLELSARRRAAALPPRRRGTRRSRRRRASGVPRAGSLRRGRTRIRLPKAGGGGRCGAPRMTPFVQSLLATLWVGALALIGIVFLFVRRPEGRGEAFLLSFAAGVLLATTFLDLLPEA